MTMQRDMTEKQYREALKRHGIVKDEYSMLGYCHSDRVPGLGISDWNAGPIRRAKLAYLITEFNKAEARERKKQTVLA